MADPLKELVDEVFKQYFDNKPIPMKHWVGRAADRGVFSYGDIMAEIGRRKKVAQRIEKGAQQLRDGSVDKPPQERPWWVD